MGLIMDDIHKPMITIPESDLALLKFQVGRANLRVRALETELEEYKTNARRYARVRRMNVRQFAELYQANLDDLGPFDALVDRLIAKGA